jgi:sec-independent protein translocase protein TatC
VHFNASSFDTLVQARSCYQFILFTMLATGLFFEIPIAVLALNRAGVLSTHQLRKHRRYAIVAIAALALLLPGTDPVTTLLELIPMLALYELSILGTAVLERRDRRQAYRHAHPSAGGRAGLPYRVNQTTERPISRGRVTAPGMRRAWPGRR